MKCDIEQDEIFEINSSYTNIALKHVYKFHFSNMNLGKAKITLD